MYTINVYGKVLVYLYVKPLALEDPISCICKDNVCEYNFKCS